MSVAYQDQEASLWSHGPFPLRQSAACSLVVIDSQPLVREGLVSLIRTGLPNMIVRLSGSSIHEGISVARQFPGACAIVGTRRDDTLGREVQSITAFAMHDIPVLVLVDQTSVESLEAATIAGAQGYLGKDAAPKEFLEAISKLATGQPCSPALRVYREGPTTTHVQLSEQERRVLVLYASGLKQDVVGRRMGIASSTVKYYLDRVRFKYSEAGVQARTKLELNAIARADGFLP